MAFCHDLMYSKPHCFHNAPLISGSPYTTVIFDLGDVLFTWSASKDTVVSPSVLKNILRSYTWFEYEKGNISEAACYDLVAKEFGISAHDVAIAFQEARNSLKSDPEMLDLIRDIKGRLGQQVFAMSNISAPAWEALNSKIDVGDWALFDRVFISAVARERKPNLGFFRHVVRKAGADPQRIIFIDDKLENVLAARSLGMHGIVFESAAETARKLTNLLGDSVERASSYLHTNRQKLYSVTTTNVTVQENFAQLLIFELTQSRALVDYFEHPRLFNFFKGNGQLTTSNFPFDIDTTSIALTVTKHINLETKHAVMNEMLEYVNSDNILQVYFDHRRPRIDPVVCVNALTLFYTHGRGNELQPTQDWVFDILLHRAYLDGTPYYSTPEAFLFFLSRLLTASHTVCKRFLPLFAERVMERIGAGGDALALSMRILATASIGICACNDTKLLLSMQEQDGSWPVGWIYKYGSSGLRIGNKGLTTAFAISAIKRVEELHKGKDYDICGAETTVTRGV